MSTRNIIIIAVVGGGGLVVLGSIVFAIFYFMTVKSVSAASIPATAAASAPVIVSVDPSTVEMTSQQNTQFRGGDAVVTAAAVQL